MESENCRIVEGTCEDCMCPNTKAVILGGNVQFKSSPD